MTKRKSSRKGMMVWLSCAALLCACAGKCWRWSLLQAGAIPIREECPLLLPRRHVR
jgi:hypothetical protein